jgi:tRNA A-37 threonylcarbamoyl transferase component Bud32
MRVKTSNYFINNTRWFVKSITLDRLKGIIDSIYTGNNCEVIHNGYFKKVVKCNYEHESFYIKQYTTKHSIDTFKSFFSTSKAHREWNRGHLLLKNNLLTAVPVAIGEKRHFGMLRECFIISKAVPNGISIRELLVKIQQSSADNKLLNKKTLLSNLTSYVRMIHDKGVLHGELHAENILIEIDTFTSFYLLDLGRMKFRNKGALSQAWRIREISRLLYSIIDVCTDEEITDMIKNYIRQTSLFKREEKFQKTVMGEIYRIKHRLWYSRSKKCLRTNNVFKIVNHHNYKINMRNEWDVNNLVVLVNRHTVLLKENLGNIIKISPKVGITRIQLPFEDMPGVCIKEYKYPSVFKRFLYCFCNSPARKAWFSAHGLMTLKFLTPKQYALIEERVSIQLKRSFIVMEDISNYLPCNKYIDEMFKSFHDKIIIKKKRDFISCLAVSFRRLHDTGVYHHDLKANNIMVEELHNKWNFYYLDLDRIYFSKKVSIEKKIKNLSQINASLSNIITYTDRLRFYLIYANIKALDIENKLVLRTIIRASIRRKHVWNPGVLGSGI